MRIVIDKSALQAMSGARFRAICLDHEVWLTEVLFYELVTTDNIRRSQLFRKIGNGDNNFLLITNSGYLFGREIERNAPVDVVRDSGTEGIRWIFNSGFQDPNWAPEEHMPDLAEWRADTENRVNWFRERAAGVAQAFFPELMNVRPGDLSRVAAAQENLSGDSELVRKIYGLLAVTSGREVPIGFGPQWLTYRSMQAQLLWSLDHIARYGAGDFNVYSPRLENTYCDAEYAVIASFADAFLSRDNGLMRLFRLMDPDIYSGRDLEL